MMKLNQSVDLTGRLASNLLKSDTQPDLSPRLPGLNQVSPIKSMRASDF